MKVAVIGANGQLGTDLCQTLKNVELIRLTHTDIEITNINSVTSVLKKHLPDVIINTAAFVRVDDCETEIDKAFQVNALGARNVAVISQELNARLVHLSTDYVFGGNENRTTPYTEFDEPAPVNIYGKSNLAGEFYVQHLCHRYFIVRTSGLFGTAGSSGKGGNFVETILKLAKESIELKVVNDQVFSPTYSHDLALKIAWLINTEYYGTYHITNNGSCSWYEFACEIIKRAGIKTTITPVTSEQYPQKARRARYTVLDNFVLKLMNIDNVRKWQEALQDYMIEKKI